MNRRSTFLLLLALAGAIVAHDGAARQHPPARPAAKPSPGARAAKAPQPSATVRALLGRAAKQKDEAAAQTLETAARLAEASDDRNSLLAVAAAAYRLGEAALDRRDDASAERL